LCVVHPVRINSKLVTAQLRDRYYWTNIRTKRTIFDIVTDIPQPKDLNIMFKDIIDNGYVDNDKSFCLLEGESRPNNENNQLSLKKRLDKSFQSLVWVEKQVMVKVNTKKGYTEFTENDCLNMTFPKSITRRGRVTKGKSPCLLEGNDPLYCLDNFNLRILNKRELCRLQGFPSSYCDILTRNKAASLLGDGWTLPIIKHILSFMDPLAG